MQLIVNWQPTTDRLTLIPSEMLEAKLPVTTRAWRIPRLHYHRALQFSFYSYYHWSSINWKLQILLVPSRWSNFAKVRQPANLKILRACFETGVRYRNSVVGSAAENHSLTTHVSLKFIMIIIIIIAVIVVIIIIFFINIIII